MQLPETRMKWKEFRNLTDKDEAFNSTAIPSRALDFTKFMLSNVVSRKL